MASYDIPDSVNPPKRKYSVAQAIQDIMNKNVSGAMMKTTSDQYRSAAGIKSPSGIKISSGTSKNAINMGKISQAAKTIGQNAKQLTPFLSNIANSFKSAPMPKMGTMNSSPTLSTVDFSNERNDITSSANAANKATDRNVDPNTAEAIKLYRRGNTAHELSDVNSKENNTNIGIKNQQAMTDYQVQAGNNDTVDEYNKSLLERDIANQREHSANIANAGDKLTLIGNENQKAKVENQKVQVLSGMFNRSGVLTRNNSVRQSWKDMGLDDPLGREYSDLEKKAYGGEMGGPGDGMRNLPDATRNVIPTNGARPTRGPLSDGELTALAHQFRGWKHPHNGEAGVSYVSQFDPIYNGTATLKPEEATQVNQYMNRSPWYQKLWEAMPNIGVVGKSGSSALPADSKLATRKFGYGGSMGKKKMIKLAC